MSQLSREQWKKDRQTTYQKFQRFMLRALNDAGMTQEAARLARCGRCKGHFGGCQQRWFCLACGDAVAWKKGYKAWDRLQPELDLRPDLVPLLLTFQIPLESDPFVQIEKHKALAKYLFRTPLVGMTAAKLIAGAIWRVEAHMADLGRYAFHHHSLILIPRSDVLFFQDQIHADVISAYAQKFGDLTPKGRLRIQMFTSAKELGSWTEGAGHLSPPEKSRRADVVTVVHYVCKPSNCLWIGKPLPDDPMAGVSKGGVLDFPTRCLLAEAKPRLGNTTGLLRGSTRLTKAEENSPVLDAQINECIDDVSPDLLEHVMDDWGMDPVLEVRAELTSQCFVVSRKHRKVVSIEDEE